MKIWTALNRAITGWTMILRGEPGWRGSFALTAAGLATALIIFVLCAFLAIALALVAIDTPDLAGIFNALLVHGIWITALFVGIRVTAMAVRSEVKTLSLLVPGVYLLVAYLLIGSVLNLIFAATVMVLTLALIYPLFRLGRAATDWSPGVSLAFATTTVLLLVVVPQALYMLSSIPGTPA